MILLDVGPADVETRERLRQEAFAQMRRGIDSGGAPYPTRESLYDRERPGPR